MHADENILLPQDNEFLPENAGTSDDGECAVSAPRAARRSSLKALFSEKKYLLLCFFVPAALMWLIYIALKTYPFGESSVLVLDLNGQYVYYFEALRRLLHGEGSILYSFGRALGGEFLGIFAYYLASPFSFLVALFPQSMITEALLVLFLLKTGLCGLNFGIYLDATRKRNPINAVIFSTMYALCAYAVVQQHNTMWIDNMLFLPLILLGIEHMIRFGRYKLFVITLSLAVLSNYYIGYMTCIFVAVYFFYYYFSCTPAERNPLGVRRHFLKSFGRIAFFSAIVVCIASVIILPAYYSLTFGKTTFSDPSFALSQKFDFLDMITKMYFGSYDTVRPEGLPFLYCGMLTFLLLPLYFLSPRIHTREKIATGLLVTFFVLSFNASTLDLVWHGFQRPNWLNYRQSFMLCFLFVLMAYKAFESLREIGYRYLILSAGFISLLLILLQKLDYKNLPDFTAVWASLCFIGIYLAVLRACTMPDPDTAQTGALILAIVVSLEMFCGGLANMNSLDADVVISTRTSYRSFIDRVQPLVEEVQAQDSSFYRMEKTLHRKTNDNLTLGMRGLSNSTSTLNAKVIQFLNRAGLSSKSHWSKYYGGTPVLDSITGIKYLIAEADEQVSPLYHEILSSDQDLKAYENPYALSLAFGVDPALYNFDFGDSQDATPFERMNHLITEMLGEEKTVKVFRKAKTDNVKYDNCDISMVVGHKKYTPERSGAAANIRYTLTAESSEMLYCYFPSEYPREVSMRVNGKSIGNFFGNETFAIKQIGSFEPGEEITVTVTLEKDELYLATNETFFYYLDEDVFRDAMERLSASQFQIDTYTEDTFSGTICVAEGQELVFTSIPYDAGWVVTVDGEEVETLEVLEALMAFRVTPGEHTLEMEYRPSCVRYGLILSGAGLAVFAAVWIGEAVYRKKAVKKNNNAGKDVAA
ncbi:MAG: YfhO family protein [Eubacteriales bacterium]